MADEQKSDESGRAKGGRARAAKLPPKTRKQIAQKAALARWHGEVPRATHEGTLAIGDLVLQCAVIDTGQRLLSESGVMKAFGIQPSGSAIKSAMLGPDDPERLPMFVAAGNLRPFIDNDLLNLLKQPILYRPRDKGRIGRGLDARLIPKVCEVWLRAREAGVLRHQQLGAAARAEALVLGLAHTGIIALVDEATGYQEVRDRLALQAILDAYLSKELAAWARRFPTEYYQEIFRLREWAWDELKNGDKVQGPRVLGRYTNDLVYSRLAPGILEELQERNPVTESGRRKVEHHRWLTADVGHPALAQHLHAVIGLMRAAETWDQFHAMLNRAFPRRTNLEDLPLFNQPPAGSIAQSPRAAQSLPAPRKKAS